jgi:hypothetical protein
MMWQQETYCYLSVDAGAVTLLAYINVKCCVIIRFHRRGCLICLTACSAIDSLPSNTQGVRNGSITTSEVHSWKI